MGVAAVGGSAGTGRGAAGSGGAATGAGPGTHGVSCACPCVEITGACGHAGVADGEGWAEGS
jgi:hypothetical protein